MPKLPLLLHTCLLSLKMKFEKFVITCTADLRFSSVRYAPAVTKEQKQAIHAIVAAAMFFLWLPTEFGKSMFPDTAFCV